NMRWMTGMGSENATTTSLPRPSSRCIIPSDEPIASPSGRACDDTRNRCRSPISCNKASIFSRWLRLWYIPAFLFGLRLGAGGCDRCRSRFFLRGNFLFELVFALLHASQKLVHASAHLFRAIDGEG